MPLKKISKVGFTLMEMLIIILMVLSFSTLIFQIHTQIQKTISKKVDQFSTYKAQAYLYQRFLSDVDSSFLSKNRFVQPFLQELKSDKISFLIEESYPFEMLHDQDIGLYHVEYSLKNGSVQRLLTPLFFEPSNSDRQKYPYLLPQELLPKHNPFSKVTALRFSLKNKSLLEMIVHYDDGKETHRYLHRIRVPFP